MPPSREQSDASRPPGPRSTDPLPATVRALGWTSFLTDLSSEAIYPLLPAFVKGLGGTSLQIGLVDGVANAVAAVVRLPSGSLSDAVGRRPLVLLGYGISAVVRPLMGLAASPWAAIGVRMADRFGKGIRTAPRDALVADLAEPAVRGRAFGHIRGMDHAGAALGPLLAMLFLVAFPGQERLLFLATLLPGLATIAVLRRCVREPPRATVAATVRLAPIVSRRQAALLASVAVWSLGAASEHFLLLRASDLGVPMAAVPLIWFGMSLAKSLAATASGRYVDRSPPRRALAAGWLLFAAAYAGLAATPRLWPSLGLLLAVAVGLGLAEPAERALVARLATGGRHGGAFGWYALVQGLMALPAGLLAGWLWDRGPSGPETSFAATAMLATVACGLLLLTVREPPPEPGGDRPAGHG